MKNKIGLLLVLSMMFASVISAADHTSTTTGNSTGPNGSTFHAGYLEVTEGTTDSATARTESGALAKSIITSVTLYRGNTELAFKNNFCEFERKCTATVSATNANKAVGSHSYVSPDYGNWIGNTTISF